MSLLGPRMHPRPFILARPCCIKKNCLEHAYLGWAPSPIKSTGDAITLDSHLKRGGASDCWTAAAADLHAPGHDGPPTPGRLDRE